MLSSRQAARGFTLFETLVALGVFTFAVMGILTAMTSAVDASRSMQRESFIRESLQSRLAVLSNIPVQAFAKESDPDAQGVRYLESVSRKEMLKEDRTVLEGFWKVSVKAVWTEEGEPQEWELSHLEYRP